MDAYRSMMNRRFAFSTTCRALFFFAILGPAQSAMPAADPSADPPLRVTVLRPVYRQTIYATENLAEVVYRVNLAPAVRARMQHLVCRLLRSDGKQVCRSESDPADLEDLRFDAGSLVVKLGPGTDKCKAAGYPILFRAVVTGGAIGQTLATFFVDLE